MSYTNDLKLFANQCEAAPATVTSAQILRARQQAESVSKTWRGRLGLMALRVAAEGDTVARVVFAVGSAFWLLYFALRLAEGLGPTVWLLSFAAWCGVLVVLAVLGFRMHVVARTTRLTTPLAAMASSGCEDALRLCSVSADAEALRQAVVARGDELHTLHLEAMNSMHMAQLRRERDVRAQSRAEVRLAACRKLHGV